jgi:hypothetical protein
MKWRSFVILFVTVISVAGCETHVDRRVSANEAVTSQNLRKIRSMLLTYREECGGFPPKLELLIEPSKASGCTPSSGTSGSTVIDRELLQAISTRPVSGYRYIYFPTDPIKDAATLFEHFEIQATPAAPAVSGEASFHATDSSDVQPSSKGRLGVAFGRAAEWRRLAMSDRPAPRRNDARESVAGVRH